MRAAGPREWLCNFKRNTQKKKKKVGATLEETHINNLPFCGALRALDTVMHTVVPPAETQPMFPDLLNKKRVLLDHIEELMSEESWTRRVSTIPPAQNGLFTAQCSLGKL